MSFKSMLQDINTQIEEHKRSITPLKTDGWHRSSRSLRQRRHNGDQEVYVLRQSRPCSDAPRWRYHGCSQRRTSSHSGGSRRVRRHGIGARACRHPCLRRRRTDERPTLIKEIKQAVTILVMAKARIEHFVEAQILEAIGVDYVDESEVLTLADDMNHINKQNFRIPFVCGCWNLGEALRRIREGATMIRTNGEAGTGMFLRFRIIRQT